MSSSYKKKIPTNTTKHNSGISIEKYKVYTELQ